MKFSADQTKFSEALKRVQSVIPGKDLKSLVLQNVLLVAEAGRLTLTTTDMYLTIVTSIDCIVTEPGATTLPVKILANIVSCAPEGVVEVDVDNETQNAKILAGRARYRLSGIQASVFPPLAQIEPQQTFTHEQALVKEMMRKTNFAVSQLEDSRRSTKGLLMRWKEGQFHMVATDGRCLSQVTKEVPLPPLEKQVDIIVPLKSAIEIQRNLATEGNVTIDVVERKYAAFTFGDVKIYTKLIDDVYPAYEAAIPRDLEYSIKVDRQAMLSSLNRVQAVVSGMVSVAIRFADNMMYMSINAGEIGNGSDEIPVKYDGEEINVMFDTKYLKSALDVLDDDEITFNIRNGSVPVIIRCSVPVIIVLMPLRIS